MKTLLNVKDAADFLDISEAALRDLIKARRVPFYKRGEAIIMVGEDLLAWVRALPGVSLHEAIQNLQRPADFSDDSQPNRPEGTSPETNAATPIQLTKGRRRHHQVPFAEGGDR
jgi:Helix-turn-helix domain